MSRKIEDLDPDVAEALRSAENELQVLGIPHIIWCTARTQLEQIAQYAQHRAELLVVQALRKIAGMRPLDPSENTYTITEADGVFGLSNHQGRRAVDIVATTEKGNATWDYRTYADRYKAIKELMKRHGFEAGADWMTKPDGTPSPYADVGLGWDPPHYQITKKPQVTGRAP